MTDTKTMHSLIEWPVFAPAIATFSDAEMHRRLSNLRATMADLNIDSVLMTSIHNVNYYADFFYCAFGRPYGLVIDQHRQTTLSANIDGGAPARRSFGNNQVYTDWQRDNYYRGVRKHTKDGSTVGIEWDHVNLQMLDKLKAALPNCKFVDISAAAMGLRMIKSAEEIAHITKMTAIADNGGAACVEAIKVGAAEHEIALHASEAMVREIAKVFPDSEIRDTWTWFQSGINTDGAHNPVTTRKIVAGDILSLNCFPMVAGYYVALERTLFAEHCSDAHLRNWQVNCLVHDAGKQLIKPGAKCSDIAKALNEIYLEHDLLQARTFGYGHSFGVLSHYYGREAGLELREDIDTVLKPGMVVSMEPMIMIEAGKPGAGGYREHDILVLTAEGAQNITHFPYGPEHNIIGA